MVTSGTMPIPSVLSLFFPGAIPLKRPRSMCSYFGIFKGPFTLCSRRINGMLLMIYDPNIGITVLGNLRQSLGGSWRKSYDRKTLEKN